ncbi:MAG: undecaprenyldiphospho-muramoylpentapeptide beta-N-acetylglucosaminyltransferase [Candidatus Blackburnbacteria bacterium RIFCSPLOWO2_02_FULL_44_9]|nr:MAG: undecaprenyldiphospho-muramoylpentapeptide beta-N-acetylglucosaminyltransferase [Candidatus Blackburnbacteria bacterium RIFCSPLOWO2_02_FULL_44_9]
MRVVITGGHLTPALATIEVLRDRDAEVFWFGEKRAFVGQKNQTLEYQVIPALGIPFFSITSCKLQRNDSLKTILNSWKLAIGFFQSLIYFSKIRPHVLLSFGSYVAVPPTLAAAVLGIPIVTHEQTTVAGLANKIIANFAKKVAVTFPSENKNDKIVLTGNPTRKLVFEIAKKKKLPQKPLTIFITGGSRGSHNINLAVGEIVVKLLKEFKVIHQTGSLDFDEMVKIWGELPKTLQKKYQVLSSFRGEEIFPIIDLAISRSGANTVVELAALGVPTIFIPLPWSGGGEQLKNARAFEETGLGVVLTEEELSPQKLLKTIKNIAKNYSSFKKNAGKAKKLANPHAAENLADLTFSVSRK